MRTALLTLACIALGCSAASAADSLEDRVRTCAANADEQARLACYDRVAASLAAGELKAPAAPVPAAAKPAKPEPASPVTARVTALRETPTDGLVITLDNGETWRTLPEDTRLLLKVGDTVTVARGAFGSFRLSTANGRVARVNRLR